MWDLRGTKSITDYRSVTPGTGGRRGGRFSVSYVALHRYVRRPGIESDYHMLAPMEYHADTVQLVQMLRKGHNDVKLAPEDWDRLITWIDLNAPYHGTWTEAGWSPKGQRARRRELLRKYAGLDLDPEAVPTSRRLAILREGAGDPGVGHGAPRMVARPPIPSRRIRNLREVRGWPFDADEAKRRQAALKLPAEKSLDLGGGVTMKLVPIPPGEFAMGDPSGCPDERPVARATISEPFWMGACEVSNEQFARFDPTHDSRVESKNAYQFGVHGYPVNQPTQPVVRVSWQRAAAFCRWLSSKTGERVTLPTEAQWEWACRAGSAQAFSFGALDADYSKFANVADKKLREFASNPYTVFSPLRNATKYDDWIPRDDRFDDGGLLSMPIGSYQPNSWGLHDMHGNVFEWTRSEYRPYPYREAEGAKGASAPRGGSAPQAVSGPRSRVPGSGLRVSGSGGRVAGSSVTRHASRVTRLVVRGGSWRDRPSRGRSGDRLAARPSQGVYNVGVRVVCAPRPAAKVVAEAPRP